MDCRYRFLDEESRKKIEESMEEIKSKSDFEKATEEVSQYLKTLSLSEEEYNKLSRLIVLQVSAAGLAGYDNGYLQGCKDTKTKRA